MKEMTRYEGRKPGYTVAEADAILWDGPIIAVLFDKGDVGRKEKWSREKTLAHFAENPPVVSPRHMLKSGYGLFVRNGNECQYFETRFGFDGG
jgi:hypothetical protein